MVAVLVIVLLGIAGLVVLFTVGCDFGFCIYFVVSAVGCCICVVVVMFVCCKCVLLLSYLS